MPRTAKQDFSPADRERADADLAVLRSVRETLNANRERAGRTWTGGCFPSVSGLEPGEVRIRSSVASREPIASVLRSYGYAVLSAPDEDAGGASLRVRRPDGAPLETPLRWENPGEAEENGYALLRGDRGASALAERAFVPALYVSAAETVRETAVRRTLGRGRSARLMELALRLEEVADAGPLPSLTELRGEALEELREAGLSETPAEGSPEDRLADPGAEERAYEADRDAADAAGEPFPDADAAGNPQPRTGWTAELTFQADRGPGYENAEVLDVRPAAPEEAEPQALLARLSRELERFPAVLNVRGSLLSGLGGVAEPGGGRGMTVRVPGRPGENAGGFLGLRVRPDRDAGGELEDPYALHLEYVRGVTAGSGDANGVYANSLREAEEGRAARGRLAAAGLPVPPALPAEPKDFIRPAGPDLSRERVRDLSGRRGRVVQATLYPEPGYLVRWDGEENPGREKREPRGTFFALAAELTLESPEVHSLRLDAENRGDYAADKALELARALTGYAEGIRTFVRGGSARVLPRELDRGTSVLRDAGEMLMLMKDAADAAERWAHARAEEEARTDETDRAELARAYRRAYVRRYGPLTEEDAARVLDRLLSGRDFSTLAEQRTLEEVRSADADAEALRAEDPELAAYVEGRDPEPAPLEVFPDGSLVEGDDGLEGWVRDLAPVRPEAGFVYVEVGPLGLAGEPEAAGMIRPYRAAALRPLDALTPADDADAGEGC